MTDIRSSAIAYANDHREQFLEMLKEFTSIPSVSTDPDQKGEMQRAAEWLADRLRALGAQKVTIFPTDGHPIVYGEIMGAGAGKPTALVYGHYDVQPAEPLELWESEPFTATVRGENIYGRGTTDMKGQILATLNAIEAVQSAGEMPINLKFLLEGEEEIGSPNLLPFICDHTDLLACDFALNPDTGIMAVDLPAITYALRGLAFFELKVYGPDHDLHSGSFGGVVHNPAQALCELIAGMHDENGRVTLPGFYDRVRELDQEERAELARLPIDEAYYLNQTGAPAIYGEAGYTPVERVGARPTLEVNGLYSGYIGAGAKTVLPAYAMAKISMRLVPDQDPKDVKEQLTRYLEEKAPKTIRWELEELAGGPASISDRRSPAVQAMSKALEAAWGTRPVFRREGGSVPVIVHFQEHLKVESVNTGFSLPEDRPHGPNEKLHLPTWYRGIESLIHFFFNVAEG